jgi:hypothetical protein
VAKMLKTVNEAYSSGYCSGFSPDSLFIVPSEMTVQNLSDANITIIYKFKINMRLTKKRKYLE